MIEIAFGPYEQKIPSNDFRSQAVKGRSGQNEPGFDFQRRIDRYGMLISNVQITGQSADFMVKKAMGHRRIEQCGRHAAMQQSVISLQIRGRLIYRSNGIVPGRPKVKPER